MRGFKKAGIKMIDELFEIFKRNFPFIVRAEQIAINILKNKDNKIIDKRNEENELIGVSVINRNTIILFCVDEEYRNRGIGTELLTLTENIIKKDGYNEITVGVGFDYLMPGVPTNARYFKSENEKLYNNINDEASRFFSKRGYKHSWNCNCFDMRLSLNDFSYNVDNNNNILVNNNDISTVCVPNLDIGFSIDNVVYRWGKLNDLDEICKCTDNAYKDFTQYYKNQSLYDKDSRCRVLVAAMDNEIVGTLIVNIETDGRGIGSFGCTTVRRDYQGKHIAVNMVTLGTVYLKEIGMTEVFLGYTYSGLDYLYGYAGYKICLYYMMAKKKCYAARQKDLSCSII